MNDAENALEKIYERIGEIEKTKIILTLKVATKRTQILLKSYLN
ncbi:hypothetical protein ACFPFV_11625 [Salinicoccus siamensis]